MLLAFALSMPMQAKEWNVDDIPVPYLKDRTQHILDPDNLLGENAKQDANIYLDSLEATLGIQSVFIVVNRVPNADCFRFAEDFGNKYGVGTKKDRNGLVIVIAVDDRRYFVAPGKGLEEHLTDVECNDISQDCIVENMKDDNLDNAVLRTSQAVYWNLKGDSTHYDSIVYSSAATGDDNGFVAIIVAILFLGFPLYLAIRKILEHFGIVKPRPKNNHNRGRRRDDIDDFFPPFCFGGGGSSWGGGSGGGFSGGSFGGGSFGGGGSGGGW